MAQYPDTSGANTLDGHAVLEQHILYILPSNGQGPWPSNSLLALTISV